MKSSEKNEVPPEACLQPDLDELVRVANQWPIGKPFHVRDLMDSDIWRAWYLYWYVRNISKVLQLGKKFYRHPELNAKYIGKDPNPKDGAAMYVNQ